MGKLGERFLCAGKMKGTDLRGMTIQGKMLTYWTSQVILGCVPVISSRKRSALMATLVVILSTWKNWRKPLVWGRQETCRSAEPKMSVSASPLHTVCHSTPVSSLKDGLIHSRSHLLTDLSLDSARDARIAHTEEAAGWCARSEPVTTGQALHQRLKMDLQVNWRVLLWDLSQGFHSFVSDYRLFHCGKTLQRGLCTTNKWG